MFKKYLSAIKAFALILVLQLTVFSSSISAEISTVDWGGASVSLGNTNSPYSSDAVPSSDGGVLTVWYAFNGSGYEMRVQKLNSKGQKLWGENGILIPSDPGNGSGTLSLNIYNLAKIVSDEEGGAIVVWGALPNGYVRSYAQRISSNGELLWGYYGNSFTTSNTNIDHEWSDTISDGNGGVIIRWIVVHGITECNTFLQRIDANGNRMWGETGLDITLGTNCAVTARFVKSDGENIIYSWVNDDDDHILVQKYNLDGSPQWSSPGIDTGLVPDYGSMTPFFYITSDSDNGAYINTHKLITKVNNDGTLPWGSGGIDLANLEPSGSGQTGTTLLLNPIVSDNLGNLYVTGTYDNKTYVQKFNSSGVSQWSPSLLEIANVSGREISSTVNADNTLSVYFIDGPYLKTQQISSSGSLILDNAQLLQKVTVSQRKTFNLNLNTDITLFFEAGRFYIQYIDLTTVTGTGVIQTETASPAQGAGTITHSIDLGNGEIVSGWVKGDGNLYLQKIASDGSLPWGNEIQALTGITRSMSGYGNVVGDGAGNIYVSTDQSDMVKVQKISTNGTPLWSQPTNVIIPNLDLVNVGDQDLYDGFMVSDGAGGVVVAWSEERVTSPGNVLSNHTVVQRIDAEGNRMWGNGVTVFSKPFGQIMRMPVMALASDGNILISSFDGNSGDGELWVQKLDLDGNKLWGAEGTYVMDSGLFASQVGNYLVADNYGGAYVGSSEVSTIYRLTPTGSVAWSITKDINMQHWDSWTYNGIYQSNFSPDLEGNLVTFGTPDTDPDRIYIQKYSYIDGSKMLGVASKEILTPGISDYGSIITKVDDNNNFLIGWTESPNLSFPYDLRIAKLDSNGNEIPNSRTTLITYTDYFEMVQTNPGEWVFVTSNTGSEQSKIFAKKLITNYQISNLASSLNAIDMSGSNIELGSPSGLLGPSFVRLQYSSGYLLADTLTEMTQDRDWSGVTANVNAISKRAYVNGLLSADGIQGSITMYVPKSPSDTHVYICPGVNFLYEITTSCLNGYSRQAGFPGISISNIGGQDYWVINTVSSVGGVSYTPNVPIPEPDPDDDNNGGNNNGNNGGNNNNGGNTNTTGTTTIIPGNNGGTTTNPQLGDSDGDGVSNEDEIEHGTNPNDADSDDDGLNDGFEGGNSGGDNTPEELNPNNPDSDDDGTPDGDEDFDNDGLTNFEEQQQGTDPNNPDTDGDGLLDGEEVDGCIYNPGTTQCSSVTFPPTNPTDADSDDDGIYDGDDVEGNQGDGTQVNPYDPDTDDDGILDGEETQGCMFIPNTTQCSEYTFPETNPIDPDTDDDGLTDGEEILGCVFEIGTRTCSGAEFPPTDPRNPDSNGNGILDGDEVVELIQVSEEVTLGEQIQIRLDNTLVSFRTSAEKGEISNVLIATTLVTASVTAISYPGFLTYGLLWFRRRKKYSPWGIVFDKETNKPLPFATIRVVNNQSEFVTQVVSDINGKYSITVAPGSYGLEVQLNNYQEFNQVVDVKEESITMDIGMSAIGYQDSMFTKFRNSIKNNLSAINGIVFYMGFIFALVATVLSFNPINLVVLIIFIVQIIIFGAVRKGKAGSVYDSSTGEVIKGAFIRVFDESAGRQIGVAITDNEGKYNILLKPGTYLLKVESLQYQLSDSKYIDAMGIPYLKVIVEKEDRLELEIPLKVKSTSNSNIEVNQNKFGYLNTKL